jgi:hypothetical protein
MKSLLNPEIVREISRGGNGKLLKLDSLVGPMAASVGQQQRSQNSMAEAVPLQSCSSLKAVARSKAVAVKRKQSHGQSLDGHRICALLYK